MTKLPLYKITVDPNSEDLGLDFVSFVEDPAIIMKGIAFLSNQVKDAKFYFSKERQVIVGPALIPDLQIYRNDDELGEYNVVFTAEQIEILIEKFNKTVKSFKINVDHSDVVKSAFINESWIVRDKEKDKAAYYGFDVPVGTWMIEVKVDDLEYWKELKETGKTGFSVEGFFNLKKTKLEKINKINLMKTKLKDGTDISSPDAELTVGSEIFIYDAEGKELAAPDGEHTLEDGTTITVAAGKVTVVKKPEAAAEATPEEKTKMALTPEDITSIWEALKPMVQEMLDGKETDLSSVEENMNAVKAGFEKQISDLKETISKTPAVESVKKPKLVGKFETDFEKDLKNIQAFAQVKSKK